MRVVPLRRADVLTDTQLLKCNFLWLELVLQTERQRRADLFFFDISTFY